MIAAVATAAQRQAFLEAARRDPMLCAVLGRDLTLWAGNSGAPVQLYLAGGAALSLSDGCAWMSGLPDDPEELHSFLRFAGVGCLQTPADLRDWPGLRPGVQDTGLTLPPGGALPQPPLPEGFVPDREVGVGEAAGLLFPTHSGYRDGFYSRTCTAVNHGLARLWGLRDRQGRLRATMGADALFEGQAYLSLLHTDPACRGQGLGGWLVVAMANALSAEGWQCVFYSEPRNRAFYRRLGFAEAVPLYAYQVGDTIQNQEG